MKLKTILFILLTTISANLFCQDIAKFKEEFVSALDESFDREHLNEIFSKYPTLITPQSGTTQLMSGLKGERLTDYPLVEFKNEELYIENIDKLLNSDNSYQRIFSYLVIGASNDKSKEQILLKRLKEETEKGNLIWCGMALLCLKTNHTTELFDFLVENEDFGDAQMLPLFIQLDNDSLRETAYQRYNSEDIKAQILAVQLLSLTGKNPRTEQIVLDAVKNWDIEIKGYAIFSVIELEMGNLLETFEPFLEDENTRKIALMALANSPTVEDNEYVKKLAMQKDKVSDDLLDCFFESDKTENLIFWIELIKTKRISDEYSFSVPDNKLIYSDELLPYVQSTLKECKNEKVIAELVRALEGRSDIESTEIILNLLKHKNYSIRYWSAESLKGNQSQELKALLPSLITNEQYRTVALVDVLIANNVNNFQTLFDEIYKESSKDLDWERSSIEYLSHFPLEEHKKLFRSILENKDADFAVRYDAALGLGRLKDTASLDLLIRICEETRKESDLNVRTYLTALAMIKGDKAKKEVESFLNSDESIVRELATELIENWD